MLDNLEIDEMLDNIYDQVRYLSYVYGAEKVIIDISEYIYNTLSKSTSITKNKKIKLFGVDVHVVKNTPERYFRVSKKDEAILNTKTKNKPTEFYCLTCKSCLGTHVYNFCPHCGSRLRGLTAERRIYKNGTRSGYK